MKQNKFRNIRVIIGLILILGGIYAVFFVDWKDNKPEQIQPIRPLKMFTVGQVSWQVRKYPGKIAALDRVTLGFQVDGPLVELPIKKGQKVRKGDLLAKIDPRDFQNKLDSAKAELEQTLTQLQRITKAAQTGAVSKTDLTNAKADFEHADANFRIVKKALEDTQLHSPFDGVISNVFVDNYQNVLAKQQIVSIQKGFNLLIEVNVPEERIMRTRESDKEKYRFVAIFDSMPNREFDVKLYEYALEADPVTQTYQITFSMLLPEDVTILPGMTATILEYPKRSDQPEKTFLVLIDAVPLDQQGQYYVWKIEKQSGDIFTVYKQNVDVGKIEGDKIQIVSGLNANDIIAASGIHMLKEGQKIRQLVPENEEANQ